MNSASTAMAPPPASSSRCGAARAWARASSSALKGAPRLNWLPLTSKRACELASWSSAPASCQSRSCVIASGASQLCVRYTPLSPATASNPETSQVTSTGTLPALDGTKPSGVADRSGATPTTRIRTPIAARIGGTGPPPARSIGHCSARQGPSRPRGASGSHGPRGAIAAGRTTTPPSRTGFISTTSVWGPKPSRRSSARACSVTPRLTGPCQVTRMARSGGEVLLSTERALWSPATCACAATPAAKAAANAMPSAGSNHLAGRRRLRAAASFSGANKPRTPVTNQSSLRPRERAEDRCQPSARPQIQESSIQAEPLRRAHP